MLEFGEGQAEAIRGIFESQMWIVEQIKPDQKEIAQAKIHPNGWVYRIDGDYGGNVDIPPSAIVGAWKVDEKGVISGNFVLNPNYRLTN